MRDSKPNTLLSGLLLTGFLFVVLWFGFSYALAISMLVWGDFLQPPWYENVIVIAGGAVSAWLVVKKMMRWIGSWQATVSCDGSIGKQSR